MIVEDHGGRRFNQPVGAMRAKAIACSDPRRLTEDIRERGLSLGASLVAMATVDRWRDPPPYDPSRVHVYPHSGYLPTDILPSAQSVIVFAVRMLDGVMDATVAGINTPATVSRTTAIQGNFAYIHLNRKLHTICYELASWLEDAMGFRSVPLGVDIGIRYNTAADDDPRIIGPAHGLFSLKRAAVLVGLGRKARNGLVASPKYGTRMRMGCVITSAPVVSDPLIEGDPCPTGCEICYRVCPTDALTPDGRVNHLRCFSDVGRRGVEYTEIKDAFKKIHPSDEPGANNIANDVASLDGQGNRWCRIACVAFCPLGERRMPDVVRRVNEYRANIPKFPLKNFPENT